LAQRFPLIVASSPRLRQEHFVFDGAVACSDFDGILMMSVCLTLAGGRLQIGTMAGFRSVRVAGFIFECLAGLVGIRSWWSPLWRYRYGAIITDWSGSHKLSDFLREKQSLMSQVVNSRISDPACPDLASSLLKVGKQRYGRRVMSKFSYSQLSILDEVADARVCLATELALRGISREQIIEWDNAVRSGVAMVYLRDAGSDDEVVLAFGNGTNIEHWAVRPEGLIQLVADEAEFWSSPKWAIASESNCSPQWPMILRQGGPVSSQMVTDRNDNMGHAHAIRVDRFQGLLEGGPIRAATAPP
jgi:hypothetical protein